MFNYQRACWITRRVWVFQDPIDLELPLGKGRHGNGKIHRATNGQIYFKWQFSIAWISRRYLPQNRRPIFRGIAIDLSRDSDLQNLRVGSCAVLWPFIDGRNSHGMQISRETSVILSRSSKSKKSTLWTHTHVVKLEMDEDHTILSSILRICDWDGHDFPVSFHHIPSCVLYSRNMSRLSEWFTRKWRCKSDTRIWFLYCLVVWNMFYFSIYWEVHHPNWRTHIFQRGLFNHQPVGAL